MKSNSTSFLNAMYSVSLKPIISKPTRITDNSARLIDNFFINEPYNFESGIIISDISEHFQIFFGRKIFFCTNSSKNMHVMVHVMNSNKHKLSFNLNQPLVSFNMTSVPLKTSISSIHQSTN